MIATCAHTKTRSSGGVRPPPERGSDPSPASPNNPDSAFDTGEEPSGHSLSPSAIREACHSSSVVTIPAISARIRSASPRWLPSKRAGRWILRMITAPITPTSTITANRSTMNANQPWSPSHGSVDSRSTAPIIAITIVGKRTRKPQKIAAWIRPGTSRWSSFLWPSTITASFSTRFGRSPKRSTGVPSLTRSTSSFARLANSVPLAARSAASATAPSATSMGAAPFRARRPRTAVRSRPRLPELLRDRGNHLGEIADHRVVGVREDWRLGVGVDGEDLLRALAAGDVLRGAADATRDVEVGRHLRAGLADLIGVRPPARHRHNPRAADRRLQEAGELLEHPEPVSRPNPAAPADHDLRLGERDAGRRRLGMLHDPHHLFLEFGLELLHIGGSPVDRAGLDHVGGNREDLQVRIDARLFEKGSAPAHSGHCPVTSDRDAVGGKGQIAACGEVREHLVASIRPRRHDRVRRDPIGELVEAGRPGGRRI